MRLGRTATEAGLPDGVFNVLQGNAHGQRLLVHPGIDAISFVGSTPVARHVYETGDRARQARAGARRREEPMVVLPDADLDVAADAAVNAGLRRRGRTVHGNQCGGRRRRHRRRADRQDRRRMDKLDGRPRDDPASEIGPVITKEHRDRIANYVDGTAGTAPSRARRDRTRPKPGFFVGPRSSTACVQA